MKNIIGKLLLFILSITYYCELNAATTFTIDGIVYEVNIDYSKYPYEEDGTCKASMFRGNSNVKDVVIPSRVTYNYKTYTVSTIGNSFAYNQTMIKSVVIPSSVKSINMSAFYGCTSLETLTLPEGLEKIGEYAFGGCSKLVSVNIPSTVKQIDLIAFAGCNGLSSMTVSEYNEIYDSRNHCNGIILTAEDKLISACNNTVIPNDVKIMVHPTNA